MGTWAALPWDKDFNIVGTNVLIICVNDWDNWWMCDWAS